MLSVPVLTSGVIALVAFPSLSRCDCYPELLPRTLLILIQDMISLVLVLCLLLFVAAPGVVWAFVPEPKILVVGATGTMGLRVIQGFLDVGFKPQQLKIMTRNATKPNIVELQQLGFDIVQANLDIPSSLDDICQGCSACYIHSTSSDTHELDHHEVERALNLCKVLCKNPGIQRVIYNSAAGAPDHGVARIQQKHDVEQVFVDAIETEEAFFQFTSLRATLFMEELWKRYTRPKILNGKYPLPANRKRQIYLVNVRDLGQIAGTIVLSNDGPSVSVMNIAGDCLTGPELAAAFAKAQQSPCRYVNPRWFTLKARWTRPGLYEQIKFLQTSKETTNILALREQFPTLLTRFDDFLDETDWGNRTRVFEDFAKPSSLNIPSYQ